MKGQSRGRQGHRQQQGASGFGASDRGRLGHRHGRRSCTAAWAARAGLPGAFALTRRTKRTSPRPGGTRRHPPRPGRHTQCTPGRTESRSRTGRRQRCSSSRRRHLSRSRSRRQSRRRHQCRRSRLAAGRRMGAARACEVGRQGGNVEGGGCALPCRGRRAVQCSGAGSAARCLSQAGAAQTGQVGKACRRSACAQQGRCSRRLTSPSAPATVPSLVRKSPP